MTCQNKFMHDLLNGFKIRSACHPNIYKKLDKDGKDIFEEELNEIGKPVANNLWCPMYQTYQDAIISWKNYHVQSCLECQKRGCKLLRVKSDIIVEETNYQHF